MTAAPPGEPALAEVQAQYPGWECSRGISGMYHAHNQATSQRVLAEDLLDLRDQLKPATHRGGPGGGRRSSPWRGKRCCPH
jgi:hypothetical protein